jgi:hypothetical protein
MANYRLPFLMLCLGDWTLHMWLTDHYSKWQTAFINYKKKPANKGKGRVKKEEESDQAVKCSNNTVENGDNVAGNGTELEVDGEAKVEEDTDEDTEEDKSEDVEHLEDLALQDKAELDKPIGSEPVELNTDVKLVDSNQLK